MKKTLCTALAVSALALSSTQALAYDHDREYKVTLTNITKGISFTPFLAATHNRRVGLFEVGEPASPEVGRVAEGGDTGPLAEVLADTGLVFDVESTEGLLQPGESVTINVESKRGFNRLSLISMLLPTNDTMAALKGVKLPRYGKATYYLDAYDAGTEMNDELCANIPGPRCGGTPFSPEDEGEGYVYPAQGIHGEGDLGRAAYQWQGPVVKVEVKRVY